MSDKIRAIVSSRPEDIQGILLVALAERFGGETVVTEEEIQEASQDKGVYMTVLESGLRIEALAADEVRKRADESASKAEGDHKKTEEKDENKSSKDE